VEEVVGVSGRRTTDRDGNAGAQLCWPHPLILTTRAVLVLEPIFEAELRRRLRHLLSRNGHASHGRDAGDDAETAADG